LILVVDANVTIAWIASDERSAYAEAALQACGVDPAIVPPLWYWEIANTLLVFQRKGRLLDSASTYASMLEHLSLRPESGVDRKLRGLEELALAGKYGLSIYDAAYLATAKSAGAPLATLDARLTKAAVAEGLYFSV